MTRDRYLFRPVSAASANPPLTLFTANQPMPAVIEFSPAGRKLPMNPNRACSAPSGIGRCSGPNWTARRATRAERGSQHDRQDRLPERQPEEQHADDADEDRGEFQVGRRPGPEQLDGAAVPLARAGWPRRHRARRRRPSRRSDDRWEQSRWLPWGECSSGRCSATRSFMSTLCFQMTGRSLGRQSGRPACWSPPVAVRRWSVGNSDAEQVAREMPAGILAHPSPCPERTGDERPEKRRPPEAGRGP